MNIPEHKLWYQNEVDRLNRSMRRQRLVCTLAITALIACALWAAWQMLWAILS